ncbi:MAG: SurA N-terminal domain-containing protein [Candidatus Dormibacteraeota bacterium]|nr:SurA N-terminal domain-containing protein [Candidatus Dormibacteraeota bacterium]
MRISVKGLILVATAAVALSACGSPPANTAVTVDNLNVPMHLYTVLVQSAQIRSERAGLQASPSSTAGAARLRAIEAAALKKLVRNAALEEMANERHLVVTVGELDAAVSKIEKGVGGAAVVDRQLALDHLSRQDFKDELRFTLLEQKLSLADPKGFPVALAKTLNQARVTAYVGPCQSEHSYPKCVAAS